MQCFNPSHKPTIPFRATLESPPLPLVLSGLLSPIDRASVHLSVLPFWSGPSDPTFAQAQQFPLRVS